MSRKFDLSKYETVKERKKRFYIDYPQGRIAVMLLSVDKILDYALFQAAVFTDKNDQVPRGIGYALEVRHKNLSQGKHGSYESVNYSSWTENAEESAVGRALDNAGYSGNDKCSREEIEKAERMNETLKEENEAEDRKGDIKVFRKIVAKVKTEGELKKLKERLNQRVWNEEDTKEIDETLAKLEVK